MGTVPRSYGRRVRPLDLTPVPHWAIALFPLLLGILLIRTVFQFLPELNIRIQESSEILSTGPSYNSNPLPGSDGSYAYVDLLSPEVLVWRDQIEMWALEHRLPPALVAIVMQIESCGSPYARSSAGAMGLFQVMPFHFAPDEDPYDPGVNAARGLAYLAQAFELAGGSIEGTLAGYNGGHSVIKQSPSSWAEETRRYVSWGSGLWQDIQRAGSTSPALERWLNAGGVSLCKQALEDQNSN